MHDNVIINMINVSVYIYIYVSKSFYKVTTKQAAWIGAVLNLVWKANALVKSWYSVQDLRCSSPRNGLVVLQKTKQDPPSIVTEEPREN